ncbi:MAG: TIGR04255 family protein [Desulfuromonadales bacterium]|nr:MAG: TIGR04255 family protein [Desulfuromonadales bacterium]
MSEICYKKNFLKQVIAKIDFAQPLSDLNHASLVAVIAEIKKRYPIAEQATAFQQGIEITDQEIRSSKTEFPEWNFHGVDRDKSLKINQHFLQVLLTKYTSESDFRDDLLNPVSQIIGTRPEVLIARTGVRFINIFDFEIETFGKVKEYFTEPISDHLAAIANPEQCVRSILVSEYLLDETKIRIQSGFFNPDYPAIIKRRHFVLDIDAYIDFPHQISDVDKYFRDFHAKVQMMFESHITQKLRDEVLNG